jgi:hypothetical protein
MNGENIPLLAYFFVSVTSLVLAYVTYTDEISKIPGQIKQTVDDTTTATTSSLSSLTNGLSSSFSSTPSSASSTDNAASSLTSLNPLAINEEKPSNMTGGKRKHKKTKRNHSKAKHNNTKHHNSKK